jgi:flagellar biosynthesis chaperone FliJ
MNNQFAWILAGGALWLALQAPAQQAPAPQRQPLSPDAIKTILDLTERQFTELNDLRDAHQKTLQDISTQLRELERQRREAMSAGNDPARVGTLALQIQDLQKQIQDENTAYHERALRTLDGSQRETVEKIEEALKLAPKAGALAQYGLLESMVPQRGFLGNPMGSGIMMRGGAPDAGGGMMRGTPPPPDGR